MTHKGVSDIFTFSSLLEEKTGVDVEDKDTKKDQQRFSYKERTLVFPHGSGYEYASEQLYYRYIKVEDVSQSDAMLTMPKDYVQLIFCLQGSFTYTPKGEKAPFLKLADMQHNMMHFGRRTVKVDILSKQILETVVIYIHQQFFQKFAIPEYSELLAFYNGMNEQKVCAISKRHLHLDYKIEIALRQLLEEKCPAGIGYHFVEAKIAEIMMLQWSILLNKASNSNSHLKTAQVEKMELARDILLESIGREISLKTLAHAVGTNEHHLKKHFKIVFGDTVFGYLQTHKMNKAKKLLMNPDTKIADVADALGYKYATHFTAAFKKFFGYSPRASERKNGDVLS